MIRIDPQKIDHWEDIKEKHKTAVKEIIKKSIGNFTFKNNVYILNVDEEDIPPKVASHLNSKDVEKKDKKLKEDIKFNSTDKKFIESLLDIEINTNADKLNVEFKNANKRIAKFAVDPLEDIFDEYYTALKELSEFKDYKDDDIKFLFNLHIYRKEIIDVIKNDSLHGRNPDTKEKRKKNLEFYFTMNNNFDKDKYLDEDFLIKYYNYDNFLKKKDTFQQAVKFKDEYESKVNTLVTLITTLNKRLKPVLEYIFNYKIFDSGVDITVQNANSKENQDIKEKWNRHKLISDLNISTCPYCNRQYITNYIGDGNKKKTTADLDHFYCQSRYPFLALSLYNFIPSCQICNSRLKSQKDFYLEKHLYPYEDSFGDNAHFKTDFKLKENSTEYNIDYLFGLSNDFEIDIKIKINPQDKDKIEDQIKTVELNEKLKNSIETFKLKEVYQSHTDYVSELIKKSLIYNESKIDELYSQYPELFKDKDDVIQLVFSNYINDNLGKRPLAKLTKDICEELGLL